LSKIRRECRCHPKRYQHRWLDPHLRAEQPVITIEAIKKAYDRERLQAIVVDVKASRTSVAITTIFPAQTR
jgi:hypothetical protein